MPSITPEIYLVDTSLYRFLVKQAWDTEQVKQIRLTMLNWKARRALRAQQSKGKLAPVYVLIDDSLVEKIGQKMAGVAHHRSHKDKN